MDVASQVYIKQWNKVVLVPVIILPVVESAG